MRACVSRARITKMLTAIGVSLVDVPLQLIHRW